MLKHLEKKADPLTKMTIKLTPDELRMFKEKSQQYTQGNMSAWVRYATLNCKPPKSALTE